MRPKTSNEPEPVSMTGADQPAGLREQLQQCPLYQADDKYGEAHYFLERMMVEYHEPSPFRWNLNAFIQALRSVTFRIQKLLAHHHGFDSWWSTQQANMKAEPLLKKFLEGRNTVVKERNLMMNSSADIGLYRYRKLRLGMTIPVPTHVPSREVLARATGLGLLDEQHSAEGEEYGVRRRWRVPELGDSDALALCDEGWVKTGEVLTAAHDFIGWASPGPVPHGHPSSSVDLLTETDVDPSLSTKWGWE